MEIEKLKHKDYIINSNDILVFVKFRKQDKIIYLGKLDKNYSFSLDSKFYLEDYIIYYKFYKDCNLEEFGAI